MSLSVIIISCSSIHARAVDLQVVNDAPAKTVAEEALTNFQVQDSEVVDTEPYATMMALRIIHNMRYDSFDPKGGLELSNGLDQTVQLASFNKNVGFSTSITRLWKYLIRLGGVILGIAIPFKLIKWRIASKDKNRSESIGNVYPLEKEDNSI